MNERTIDGGLKSEVSAGLSFPPALFLSTSCQSEWEADITQYTNGDCLFSKSSSLHLLTHSFANNAATRAAAALQTTYITETI